MVQIPSSAPLQPGQPGQVVQPAQPKPSASASPVAQTIEIEIPLPEPAGPQDQGPDTGHLQTAGMQANQLNFEQMSTRILEEVGKVQRLDKSTAIVVKIGERSLKIDASMLDKNKLQAALEQHFGDPAELGSPAHLASVQQLQDQSRPMLVQILQRPSAGKPLPEAALKSLQTLAQAFEKQVPATIRQKYGLGPEQLKAWAETGIAPAGLKQLLQDYGPKGQNLYSALLHATGYGKAVTEARLKAGLLKPDQAQELKAQFDGIKSEASKRWESLNASAVSDTRKAAGTALSAYEEADKDLKALEAAASAKTSKDPKALTADDEKALAAARAKVTKAREASQQTQQTAITVATSMKDVRLRRVEAAGGAAAPEGMRVKAAQAQLDAARAEASEGRLRQLSAQGDPADALASSLQLVKDAEVMVPDWRSRQPLVTQRTEVLEAQHAALRSGVDAMAQTKRDHDRLAQMRTQLKGLPPAGQEVTDKQKALRARLEGDIARLAAQLTDARPTDPLGGPTKPHEVRMLHLYGQGAAALEQTYAADIVLNNQAHPTPDQHQRVQVASRKSRELHVEVAQAGHDAIEAQQSQDRGKLSRETWLSHGRGDAQTELDAAKAEITRLAKPKNAEETKQLQKAQKRLAAAERVLREGETRSSELSAGNAFSLLRAKALGEAFTSPDTDIPSPAQLAHDSEQRAVDRHALVGASYQTPQGPDPAWLGENGDFLRTRAQLAARSLEQTNVHAELAGQRDQIALRKAAGDQARLHEVNAQLRDAKPGSPEHQALSSERKSLDSRLHAFSETPVGQLGAELADQSRRSSLHSGPDAPLARLREIQTQQADNVAAVRAQQQALPATASARQKDVLHQLSLQTTLAAAESISTYNPTSAAAYLREASVAAAQLSDPNDRNRAQLKLKARAIDLYQAYVQQSHQSVDGAAALAAAVESTVYPHGKGAGLPDDSKTRWEALRRQSDPTALFSQHRAELRAALAQLSDQVGWDIEAGYNLAVERGGLVMGTVARAARELARQGDIEGARNLLEQAVDKAIQASEQAEIAYRALPADKQEHYRAVLRSTAPDGEKQEALEQIFGYAEHGDAHANQGAISFAAQALRVAGDSQTMQRAHQPGAEYDLSVSAQATADALADPSSGLNPKAGAAAEAIADRYAQRRARDEAYWNDPTVAIMASAVDEAALFIFTMGASTAVSLARAAITNMSRARSTLTTARRVYQGIEASRAGRTVIAVGSKAADYHHRYSQRLASFDGLLMNSGNLGRAGAQVFRFSRGMGRNLATEFSQKGLVWAAEQAGGKDSWLAWAAQTGGRLAGTGFSEIKGLDALGNGAWNVVETALTEAALPAFYKNDPKGLAEAKEGLHYLLMGVQTVHGMGKMRQQAKEQASLEADGLHTDLQRAGLELGPAQREALQAEVTRYHESLLHNQGSLKPEVHTEFAARVEAITGLKHLPADQQTALKAGLDTALSEYLAPYRIQVASTHSSFDSVKLADATPAKVKQATEAMAAELVKQGAALDHAEALKIARGQIAGQLMSQAQFGALDLTRETSSLRTDMEASARRLVELGVVDTPAQAAMIVRAEVRQHLADTAATLDTTTPAGKASWENLKQHYELTEQVSAALTQTGATLAQHHEALAGLPADKQAAADALLNQTLMGDMGRPLEAELAARLSEALGEGNTALAHDLAATAITHWAKHLLFKEDLYSEHRGGGLMTLHDRHITLLKSLGMAQPQALEVARAEQRERAVEFYTGLCDAAGQPEHKNLVEAFVRDGFARFEQKIPTQQELHAFETQIFHALLDAGFNGKQAPDLAVGIARSCMQTVLHQQSQAEARAHKDNLPIMEVLHLPTITVAGQPMTSLSEIRAYLHEGNLRDMGKMEAFYKAVGSWENLHKLSMALDPDIAARLHEARDAKVAEHWQSVEALAKAEGVTIARPYVGRGPGDKGYTGVYADVDLVVRITGTTDGKEISPAKRAQLELKLMRAMQTELNQSTPASGHDWDVNVYVTPQFIPLTLPGKGADDATLAQHHANQLGMDFLQARMGFGNQAEAWKNFKAEALATAKAQDQRQAPKGERADAVAQLEKGFKAAEERFEEYNDAVEYRLSVLKAKPEHQGKPEAVLAEMARTEVRAQSEARLEKFLAAEGEHLLADTPRGTQARLDYFRLQMDMRATLPEAYIGNPAVFWGSRINAAETKAAQAEMADHAYWGLQGRVSHAQYILHWAVDSHADLATRAWKAGKYDLRDQLFVNSINAGKGVDAIEMMDNPAYLQLAEQKKHNPRVVIPSDVPARIPASKTDRAVLEARAKATNPEQALQIWVKHFGTEAKAKAAMEAYLNVLTLTVQDTTARFLMSPRNANEAAHAHAEGAVPASLPQAAKIQDIVRQNLLKPNQTEAVLHESIRSQVEAELKAAGVTAADADAQARQVADTAVRSWDSFRPLRVEDPLARLQPHLAANQPALVQALQSEHLVHDEAKLQAQLGVFARGSAHFQALPTFDQLLAAQGRWRGDPAKAILFQTYGKGHLDQTRLEQRTAQLRGEHYGFISKAAEIHGVKAVNQDGQEKASPHAAHLHQQETPGTAGQILLTLDGSRRNQVSELSRRTGEMIDTLRHQDQLARGETPDKNKDFAHIMMEEMAMLRDAEVIYFGLTGRESDHPNSVTTSELMAIVNDPALLRKVVFFRFTPSAEE